MSKKVNNSKVALKIGRALVIPAMFGTYVSNSCSGMDFKWIFQCPALWYEAIKNYVYYDVYLSIYRKIFGFNADLKKKIYAHVCNYGKKFGFEPALCDNKAFSAESDTLFILRKEVDFFGHKRKLSVFVDLDGKDDYLKFSIRGFTGVLDDANCFHLKNPKFEDETGKLFGKITADHGAFCCTKEEEINQFGASPLERLFSVANRVFVLMNDLACLKDKKGVSLKQYRNKDGIDRYEFVFDKIVKFKDRKFGETFRVKGISYFGKDHNSISDFLGLATAKKGGVGVKKLDFSGQFLYLMYDRNWKDYLALKQAISEQLGINFEDSVNNMNSSYDMAPLVNELNNGN